MEDKNEKIMSDEELIIHIQNGEAVYFQEVMARYEKKIMNYVRRFLNNHDDARDLTQDVFVKVYRNVKSFDTTKRFSPWIYRIAHNEAINTIKRKMREPLNFFDPEVLFPHPLSAESPQEDAERKEIKKALEICLKDVSAKYREVLVLRYFEEMDYKDIAEILKIPVVTVGVRLNRGKAKLKEIYEKKYA